jgi:hypothetical protein
LFDGTLDKIFRSFQVRLPRILAAPVARADADDLVQIAHDARLARAWSKHRFEELQEHWIISPASYCER